MNIRLKRVYDPPEPDDGARILVDRVWPRGIKKTDLQLDAWLKDLAPSRELRKWFGHRPERWEEFKERYFAELDDNPEAVQPLLDQLSRDRATLLYAAKDRDCNNAAALVEYLNARKLA